MDCNYSKRVTSYSNFHNDSCNIFYRDNPCYDEDLSALVYVIIIISKSYFLTI